MTTSSLTGPGFKGSRPNRCCLAPTTPARTLSQHAVEILDRGCAHVRINVTLQMDDVCVARCLHSLQQAPVSWRPTT
ncbi:hypothetical protein RHECNPAF_1260092 [Rhizobium etli CNPAF512]|nr:hypothetical protein RHECNPAF_1260092 [Rhizobium etli CNPAF512]